MPLVRRRPLLRAAAVGGGAYYLGKRRQQAKNQEAGQEQEQQPAAGETQTDAPLETEGAAGSSDTFDQLERLGKLQEQGVLTDEEFAEQKGKLLNS